MGEEVAGSVETARDCTECGAVLSEARVELDLATCSGPCNAARRRRLSFCHASTFATSQHVTARKDYECAWCYGPIPKGAEHVVATEFPGGDSGYADQAGQPVRLRIHVAESCHHCSLPPDSPSAGEAR